MKFWLLIWTASDSHHVSFNGRELHKMGLTAWLMGSWQSHVIMDAAIYPITRAVQSSSIDWKEIMSLPMEFDQVKGGQGIMLRIKCPTCRWLLTVLKSSLSLHDEVMVIAPNDARLIVKKQILILSCQSMDHKHFSLNPINLISYNYYWAFSSRHRHNASTKLTMVTVQQGTERKCAKVCLPETFTHNV